ncbi:hypothetical protein ZWY2020_024713 [Hordeum vulgare]|nr:hypothetical protein ZWY2020_024713 [Hordeum vulgare]
MLQDTPAGPFRRAGGVATMHDCRGADRQREGVGRACVGPSPVGLAGNGVRRRSDLTVRKPCSRAIYRTDVRATATATRPLCCRPTYGFGRAALAHAALPALERLPSAATCRARPVDDMSPASDVPPLPPCSLHATT